MHPVHPFPHLLDLQTSYFLTSHLCYQSNSSESDLLSNSLDTSLHTPLQQYYHSLLSPHIWTTKEHCHQNLHPPLSSLRTTLIWAFWTLSILPIPTKPLEDIHLYSPNPRPLLLLSYHSFSLPYVRTVMNSFSCKTLAHSICKHLILTCHCWKHLLLPSSQLHLFLYIPGTQLIYIVSQFILGGSRWCLLPQPKLCDALIW